MLTRTFPSSRSPPELNSQLHRRHGCSGRCCDPKWIGRGSASRRPRRRTIQIRRAAKAGGMAAASPIAVPALTTRQILIERSRRGNACAEAVPVSLFDSARAEPGGTIPQFKSPARRRTSRTSGLSAYRAEQGRAAIGRSHRASEDRRRAPAESPRSTPAPRIPRRGPG